jgi:hypothetical protein
MKKNSTSAVIMLLLILSVSTSSSAQSDRTWKVGDKVEVKWNGRFYPATVNEVNAGKYKISYDGYGRNWDEWVPSASIRARGEVAALPATAASASGGKGQFQAVKPGKYHCVFYISGQGLQTVPGFTIQPGGTYLDTNGKKGNYAFDAAKSIITFSGAAMDGNLAKYDGKIRIYNERRSRTVIDCDTK